MSVAATLTRKEGSLSYPHICKRTIFNVRMFDVSTCKSETGVLRVNTQPPKNVCKYHLDILLDLLKI